MAEPDRQLAWEAERRSRAALAAALAGLLTLAGAVVTQLTFTDYPRVGVLQALDPALRGAQDARVNPRSPIIAFFADHQLPILAGAVLSALGTLALGAAMLFLLQAVRARRPETPGGLRRALLAGATTVALLGIVAQAMTVIRAHGFVNGSDRSRDAVHAVQGDVFAGALSLVGLLAQVALGFAVVLIALNAMRVGLLTRFMGVLGIIVGVLLIPIVAFIVPIGSLPIVEIVWLLALAVLFAGRWPSGQPPAWITGRAQPWPSQQDIREARGGGGGAVAAPAADEAPAEPMRVAHPSSKKRRKKRR